jgi:hypothetical protein
MQTQFVTASVLNLRRPLLSHLQLPQSRALSREVSDELGSLHRECQWRCFRPSRCEGPYGNRNEIELLLPP